MTEHVACFVTLKTKLTSLKLKVMTATHIHMSLKVVYLETVIMQSNVTNFISLSIQRNMVIYEYVCHCDGRYVGRTTVRL